MSSAAIPGPDLARTSPAVRPRLLFAGTTFVVGGAERVFSHLLRGLRARGHDLELLALRELGPIGEALRDEGIPAHSGFTDARRLDPALLPRLAAFLRRGRYDAIYLLDHAHAVFYLTVASFGTSVRARVMPVHTTGQWGGARSLRLPIRLVRPRLDRIVAIAEAQKTYLVEREGVPADQIVVIPNGIPLESRDPGDWAALRREIRREIQGDRERPVIGITAVLRPEKNHELLLAALARIRAELDCELWVLGDGPRRAELEELARTLGLGDAVRFLGLRSDARRLMHGFDVAVLASHPLVETLPLALLEAMDAEVPVVATRVGALAEMVEDGVSGRLVAPGDVGGLADALRSVLLDRERARAWAQAGAATVRARYSVERMVGATEALLLELLAN